MDKEIKKYKKKSMAQETWHRLIKNKGAVIGMLFLLALIAVALLAPVLFDYETEVIGQNISERFMPPCKEHWFGTDEVGRDLFARVMWGARYSLAIGVGAVALGLLVGLITGSLAGFYGGIIDSLLMRAIDIFYSIPNIMTAVVIVSVLGTSTVNLIIALAFSCASSFGRIVRAQVMTIRDQEYVESSYAMGLPTWKIIIKHILPNCLSPIIVQVTLLIGSTIISASASASRPPRRSGVRCFPAAARTSEARATSALSPVLPLCSPCLRSTCWVTACATRSIRNSRNKEGMI